MSAKFSTFRLKSKTFINISPDNRIHLWDIDTKKEKRVYVEKKHLENTYTCYASWNDTSSDDLGLFSVGSSDGTVIVWDLVRGVVMKTLGVAKESAVPTDIAFAHDGKSIFVSSNNPIINQINIATGEVIQTFKTGKKGALKIALNPKANVLASASNSIKIADMESGQKRKLNSSIAGGVTSLVFSPCGKYLACAGSSGREILLFDVQADVEVDDPIAVIAVNGIPASISIKSSKASVDIFALFENTGGSIVRFNKSDASAAICHIVSPEVILGGSFGSTRISSNNSNNSNSNSSSNSKTKTQTQKGITLAIGKQTSPRFHTFELEDSSGEFLSSLEINLGSSNNKTGESAAALTADVAAAVVVAANSNAMLGPADVAGVKRAPIAAADKDTIDGSNGNSSSSNSSSGSKRLKSSDNVEFSIDVDAAALTLEQRLESLSTSLTLVEQQTSNRMAGLIQSTRGGIGGADGPTSDSLVTLIEQALQSGDNALLEQCLTCEDIHVIEETSRRLPAAKILVLLKKLVSKFEKRPSRGILLTKWLSSILRHHTAYLIAVPDLAKQLAGLSQILEQRLATFSRLALLSGRLDLLMSQISNSSSSSGGDESEAIGSSNIKPQRVYIEE